MFWRTILVSVVFFAVGTLGYSVAEMKQQIMREKYRLMCEQSGNSDKLDELVAAIDDSMKCFENTIDLAALPREMREAMINGGLKQIFKSHCAKSSQLKTCTHTLSNGLSLCMDAKMREMFITHNNSTDEIIDFVCYNDGERIINFILENGPQCFQEKSKAVTECAEKIRRDIPNPQAFANMSTAEQCAVTDNLYSCMLNELRTCPTPAAANLMEPILQLARKSIPCK